MNFSKNVLTVYKIQRTIGYLSKLKSFNRLYFTCLKTSNSVYMNFHLHSPNIFWINLCRTTILKFRAQFSMCTNDPLSGFEDSCLEIPHIPVMLNETIQNLSLKKNGIYLDMTFGAGGHAKKILEFDSSIVLYSLDRDISTAVFSQNLKDMFGDRFHPLIGKFSDLPTLLRKRGIYGNYFSGVMMDLGVSSMQFNTPERGFMLSRNGPLDMRMDCDRNDDQPSAADVLYFSDEESLRKILKTYGQEKNARLIARAVVESRLLFKQLKTTKELAEMVASVVGDEAREDKLHRYAHPATRTFQALRIFVNDELNQLDHGIRLAHHYLQLQGILTAISFHSLEDTIIKRHFKGSDLDESPDTIGKGIWKHRKSSITSFSMDELSTHVPKPWEPLSKHVILPTEDEVNRNPRARSAKLRAALKLDFNY